MSAKRNAARGDEHAGNDLSDAIKGLGDRTAKALHRLGIRSCAELAQYLRQHTAEELSESLAEQGVRIGAKKIKNEDWLGNARKRAGQANGQPADPKRKAGVAEEREKGPNHPSDPLDEVRFGVIFKRDQDEWKVTTYDERSRDPEPVWGIEPTEWANWILEQMRPLIKLEPALPETDAGAPPEIEIAILDVLPCEAERFKQLATEVRFELSGSKKEKIAAARSPFWIQVQTFDPATRSADLAVSLRGRLEPEKFTYSEKLQFPTPAVGRYELHILVLLLPPVGRMALHKGFTLKVNP